jgi:hypothetical protein
MLANLIAIAVLLTILFSVWGGVHLLARKRMGDRQIGCRGPQIDEMGNKICCNTGEPCESSKGAKAATPR